MRISKWLIKCTPGRIKSIIKKLIVASDYITWYFIRPRLPKGNKMMLHLGCGEINIPGFINVDKRPFSHIHYLSDVEELPFIKENTVDLIYISHCLEHIPHRKLVKVLNEYHRVLKRGGILRISVPDFKKITEIYQITNDVNTIIHPLFGSQEYKYNFHFNAFDYKSLESVLLERDYVNVRLWYYGDDELKSFPDWSGGIIPVNNFDHRISLNIEAEKG